MKKAYMVMKANMVYKRWPKLTGLVIGVMQKHGHAGGFRFHDTDQVIQQWVEFTSFVVGWDLITRTKISVTD